VIIREYMPPQEAGRRTGVVFLFGACAMGFGSWMGGALFDATGSYTIPFMIGVAANCINLVIVGTLLTKARPGGTIERISPAPA
jgi:cyanate permease